MEDFAVMASLWLSGDPNIPDDMVYIPNGGFEMGDHFAPEGYDDELPLHPVLLDAFFMSKYEITNSQYCDYLNDASSLGLIEVRSGVVYASPGGTDPYCDTSTSSSYSQIAYSAGVFSVRTKDGRDMSDDPMVEVSWYGAVAYCNWRSSEEDYEACYNLSTWDCNFAKHGYRLATEAEWEYAARGGLSGKRFPWADPNITHTLANYYAAPLSYPYDVSPTSGYHPLWNGVYPYTSPVGFFDGTMKYKVDYNWPGSDTSYQTTSGANGLGLHDMAGNVWEWCNDWYSFTYYSTTPYPHVNPTGPTSGSDRVLRGGCWDLDAFYCRVAYRSSLSPDFRYFYLGFRIVLDL
jgi:formylglycine-generating enzyme required for sulfatase activity